MKLSSFRRDNYDCSIRVSHWSFALDICRTRSICNSVWQKGTYSLSDFTALCAYNFIIVKVILCTCVNITVSGRPSRKKIISSQSWKSGKASSPFLSDWVMKEVSQNPWKPNFGIPCKSLTFGMASYIITAHKACIYFTPIHL